MDLLRFKDQTAWYSRMLDVRDGALSPEEREALHRWEMENVFQGDRVLGDWPGWVKHIGPPPRRDRRRLQQGFRALWP